LAYRTKRFGPSARLYAESLRGDPKLAEDTNAENRYNAARAAALAGCRQGKDDPPPDDAARAKLRAQALGWLRDELAARSKLLDGGQPAARAPVRRALEHWQADADLAGLRDEAELAKLPEGERRAWRALWEDVGTLLKKARGDRP
jgi:serine/threonine-protein kinase